MRQNQCDLNVLVKGKPITEYPFEGQRYVEGRAGSEFELEFHNHTTGRVMAVLSVDGLSVLDGKPAGTDSSGYLVNPYQRLRVPGWKLDEQSVAKFVFAGSGGSYVEQSGGDARNRGVIGVLAYAEKPQPFRAPIHWSSPQVKRAFPVGGGNPGAFLSSGNAGVCRGYSGKLGMAPIGGNAASFNATSASVTSSFDDYADAAEPHTGVAQSLGTGFGQAAEFNTTMVNFERGDLLSMMVLYYDDRKGLRQRGIRIERPSRQKYAAQPQAFPGIGCAPPPGWRG